MSTSNPSPTEITFKCAEHAKNTSRRFLQFYEEQNFFDTTLIAGIDCIKIGAHKFVLCALSEYFLELFRCSPTLKAEIELKEIEASTVELIIDFMYSGSIKLSIETIEIILRTAAFLKMKTLIDGCCDFIEKHFDNTNCLNWLRLSKESKIPELQEISLNFAYNHFAEVSKEKEFLLLSATELKDFLFNDNPYQDFEENVFMSLKAWIEHDEENRKELQLELLSMIRYQFLTPKFIIANVSSETDGNYKLIYRWLRWHWAPETRPIEDQTVGYKKRKLEGRLALLYFNNNKEVEVSCHNQELGSWYIQKRIPISRTKINHSMIVIDEKLIVVGGKQGVHCCNDNTMESLDLKTLKWTTGSHFTKTCRRNTQLANLKGNICIFGGYDNNGTFDSSLEMYNFSTSNHIFLEPLFKLSASSKMAAHNGILYLLDFYFGYLHCYDVSTNEWTLKQLKIEGLIDFGFAAVDKYLYVIGNSNFAKRYDLLNDTWSVVAPLKQHRSDIKCTTFQNKIFIYGINYVEEYSPDTDTWKNLNSNDGFYCPNTNIKLVSSVPFDL